MATAVLVGSGGALNADMSQTMAVRLDDASTAVGTSATVNLPAMTVNGYDEAAMFVLDTDATAGEATLVLQHNSDGAGTYVDMEDGLMLGGDIDAADGTPQDSLVLDMSETANQGTILIGVAAIAAERSGGALVQQLREEFRIEITTDGSWNGTAVRTIGITGKKRHQPGSGPA